MWIVKIVDICSLDVIHTSTDSNPPDRTSASWIEASNPTTDNILPSSLLSSAITGSYTSHQMFSSKVLRVAASNTSVTPANPRQKPTSESESRSACFFIKEATVPLPTLTNYTYRHVAWNPAGDLLRQSLSVCHLLSNSSHPWKALEVSWWHQIGL